MKISRTAFAVMVSGLLLARVSFAEDTTTPAQASDPADTSTSTAKTPTAVATPSTYTAQHDHAAEAGPTVAKIAICEEVAERAPVGEADAFASAIGKLYCFTSVVGADDETQLFHRWYVGDQLISEIPIAVKSEHWRCWSRKTILPQWQGACRVEITNEAGDVLATKEFTLN
jgi:hypothetical protein